MIIKLFCLSISKPGGVMNILKITILTWGLILANTAGAANKASDSSDTKKATTRDAASGLPTGKRQHKPVSKRVVSPRDAASGLPTGKRQHKAVSNNLDNDCDGKTSAVCKKKLKKLGMKKKGYDHYSSNSAMKSNKLKQNGEDLVVRKKPGRAADADDKGKKKKPLKHEK